MGLRQIVPIPRRVKSSLSGSGSLAGEEAQEKLVAAVTTYMASASIFEAQLGQMLRAAASPALIF